MKQKLTLLLMLLFCAIFYSQAQIDNSAQQYNTLLNEYIDNNLKDYDLEKLTDREISGIKSSLRNTYKLQNNISIKNNTSKIVNGFNTFPLENSLIAAPTLVGELFENSCGITFSNVQFSSSATNGLTQQSLGSFTNSNNQNIPFNSGMILSTGFIDNADSSNLNPIGNEFSDGGPASGAWDNYFDPFITEFGEFNSGYHNGTTIKFDITPETNHISFDYIFLSEEYNQHYECNIADVFVFILEDNEDSNVEPVNMAVLPGTNTPVQVTTVHPNIFQVNNANSPGNCNAVNAQFFSHYNWNPPFNPGPNPFNTVSPGLSPTIFDGQTIELTAEAMVIPNRSYTITLAIADYLDQSYDAAVLIENGSFNSDIDLNDDVTVCNGQNTQLGISAISGASYQWALQNNAGNFNNISGATNNTYSTSVAGTYQLTVTINGCTYTDTVVVTTASTPVAQTPDDITVCDAAPNDGFALFDLTSVETAILNGQAGTVTYHISQGDADNGVNEIPNPGNYENSDQDQQTIYARLDNAGCYDTVSFDIIVEVCCTPSYCPDLDFNKVITTFSGTKCPTFDPGDELRFKICVKNNEANSCPVTFQITDFIDPQFFDITTLTALDFGSSFNIQGNNLIIDVIDLEEGETKCFNYAIDLRNDVLPESGENCANIIGLNCRYETDCAKFCVNLPDTLWPRTFGNNNSPNKMTFDEITFDSQDNVYVIGSLDIGAQSYEDPSFISNQIGVIKKFDSDGINIWTIYIDQTTGSIGRSMASIQFYNNELYALSNEGTLYKIALNGNILNSYETGADAHQGYIPQLEINQNNGYIYLSATFNKYTEASDYIIQASSSNIVTRIMKYSSNLTYLNYEEFAQDPSNNSPGSMIIYDMVFAEDSNKIFAVGKINGNISIPNNPNHISGTNSFIMSLIDNNSNTLNVSPDSKFDITDEVTNLDVNQSSNNVYINRNNKLYRYTYNLIQPTLISSFGIINTEVKDIKISGTSAYIVSGENFQGVTSKVNLNPSAIINPIWEKPISNVDYKSINLNDGYIYNCGLYIQEINFDEFYRPEYSNDSQVSFVARLSEDGQGATHRTSDKSTYYEMNQEVINKNKFVAIPNPVTNNFIVNSINRNNLINSVTIKDLTGLVRKTVSGNFKNSISIHDLNVQSGFYFVEIVYDNNQKEVINIIVE